MKLWKRILLRIPKVGLAYRAFRWFRFVRKHRVIVRLKQVRLLRKLAKALEDGDMGLVIELLGSLARTLLPAATAYLAGQGVSVESENSLLVLATAVGVYVVMQGWSIVRKLINKPRKV